MVSVLLSFYIINLFIICNSQNQTVCFWGRGEGANISVTNTIVNGEYIESGTHNGFPQYTQILPTSCQQATSITELVLFRFSPSLWRVCEATNSSVCLAFCNAVSDSNPTISSSCNGLWRVASNIDPSITVTAGLCPSSSCVGGISTSFTGTTPCTNTDFTTSIAPNAWEGYNSAYQQNVYFYFAPKYFSFVCAASYDIGCGITIWDSTQNARGWKPMQVNQNITLDFQQSGPNILVYCLDTQQPTYIPTFYPTVQPTTSYPTTISPTTSIPTTFAPTAATISPTTAFPTTTIPSTTPTTSIPTAIPTTSIPTTLQPTIQPSNAFISTVMSEQQNNSNVILGFNLEDNILYLFIAGLFAFIFCLICILIGCTCCKRQKRQKQVVITTNAPGTMDTLVAMEKLKSVSSDGDKFTDKNINMNAQTDFLPVTSDPESDVEVQIKIQKGAKMDRYQSEPMGNNGAMFNRFESEPMHNNNNINNNVFMNMNMQLQQQQMQQQMHQMQQAQQMQLRAQQMQQMNMQLHSQNLPPVPLPQSHNVMQSHYKTDTIDVNQLPELHFEGPANGEVNTVEGVM